MGAIALSLCLMVFEVPDDTSEPPQVTVKEDTSPAFLGVSVSPVVSGEVMCARIDYVMPGSSAAKAGLLTEDVIVTLDGVPTPSLDAVIMQVAKKRVGESIKARLIRAGKELSIDIQLAGRPLPSALLIQKDPPRMSGGTIQDGGGTITGSLDTSSNYIVKGSPTIGDDFTQRWTGVLDLQIDPDSKVYIKVGRKVSVAGLLFVNLIGRRPKVGDRFEIISNAKSVEGRFAETMLPKLEDSLEWRLEYDDLDNGVDADKDGKADITLSVIKSQASK